MYCVKEEMRDSDGKNFKMGFEDWDIFGQYYWTGTFINDDHNFCQKQVLAKHGIIKQVWFGPGNPWCECPVSSDHESIKYHTSVLGRTWRTGVLGGSQS